MKDKPILHPYLFAIYPVLHLYSKNQPQVSVLDTLLPVGILFVASFMLLHLISRMIDNKQISAVAVSVFFIWLFSYSAARDLVTLDVMGLTLYRHRFFIVIWCVVLALAAFTLYRLRSESTRINQYFSILAPLLIIFALVSIATHVADKTRALAEHRTSVPYDARAVSVQSDSMPDIYYIILDAYTGQDALSRYLKIDNFDFIKYLTGKGFFVAAKSHSNYSWTSLSVSSALNMEYLPSKTDPERQARSFIDPSVSGSDLILQNKVTSTLLGLGYEYVDLSIWKTHIQADPKGYMYQYATSSFSLALIRMTLLNRPLVENYLLGRVKREKVIMKFDALRNMPASNTPRFVYAHIMIPHHPYVFDENGNPPPLHQMLAELGSEKELYEAQVRYANKEIIKTIDGILSNAKRRPIIILQGDHGAYRLGKSEIENKQIRMSILNAYYVPDSCKKSLYESISPVNTFRVIFNSCFAQNYKLLPDESFFSNAEDFLAVENVTGMLEK